MTLMLIMIFLFIALGLVAPRYGTKQHVAITILAVAMTALYLFFPYRFM